MKNIKMILRMYFDDKKSMRSISAITGIPYSTINDNIALANAKRLTWPQVDAISEEALEQLLSKNDQQRTLPDWGIIENELKRAGVTLQLLWLEYKEAHPDGYQYSRFCTMYQSWSKKTDKYRGKKRREIEFTEEFLLYHFSHLEKPSAGTTAVQKTSLRLSGDLTLTRTYSQSLRQIGMVLK